ncbi:MBL fold metallo-hydrolase, partial [Cutibacterium acnes]
MVKREALTVQFVGSGDAFGSGGRLQTCISIMGVNGHLIVDCGASSLIGMRKINLDLNSIDVIAITHFHGDHSSGLAFFLYHEIKVSRRKRPLTVAGPVGIKDHCDALMSLLFPGA